MGHNRLMVSPDLGIRHGKKGVSTVNKGRRGSQSHQCVHIGRTVPQALKAGNKKLLVDNHDRRRQQQLEQPHSHMILRKKSGYRPIPHHMPHGEIHQHRQKSQRPEQAPLQHRCFPVLQSILRSCPTGCRRGRSASLFRSAVARLDHCRNNILRRRGTLHAHGIGK